MLVEDKRSVEVVDGTTISDKAAAFVVFTTPNAGQNLHRNIQSVRATGGEHEGQGRSQCELMTRVY